MDQSADVLDGRCRVVLELGQELAGSDRVGGGEPPGGTGLEHHAGELGTETVVQVTTQPAPLLLLRGHHPGPRRLHLVGQHGRADGDRQQIPELVENPLVRRSEASLARPAARDELADAFPTQPQIGPMTRRRERSDRGQHPAVDADLRGREPQRLAQGPQGRLQALTGHVQIAEVLADLRQRLDRIVA